MEQSEIVITLNYNRKYIEEIYFKGNQGSIFLNPELKQLIKIFCISLVLFLSTIIYSLLTNKGAWLIVVFSVTTFATLILYSYKASKVLKWRQEINTFIKQIELYKSHKLVISDLYFSLTQDQKETVQKWSAITQFEINDDYLMLTSNVQYLFPSKCMLPAEYSILVDKAKSHIKNGL